VAALRYFYYSSHVMLQGRFDMVHSYIGFMERLSREKSNDKDGWFDLILILWWAGCIYSIAREFTKVGKCETKDGTATWHSMIRGT
jgi:hypothetical protein